MVRMTTNLVEVLEKHRQRIIEEKLRKGWKEIPEWVFVNEIGSFINYGNFMDRYWNRVITLSGLSRRTPHDMRHTYATLRLSKGDSLAEVSKEMGHGNTDLTYKTYYKWLPKESRTNIDELDRRTPTNATQAQPENKNGLTKTVNPSKSLEAAPGFEPGNKGFADLCLSHLAMPPFKERETGFEPATSTLARLHSTAELFPLLRRC